MNIFFISDLDLGNVLLFPIDDKQSRLGGQDQVGSDETKSTLHKEVLKTLLPGNARLFSDVCRFFAVAVINCVIHRVWVYLW